MPQGDKYAGFTIEELRSLYSVLQSVCPNYFSPALSKIVKEIRQEIDRRNRIMLSGSTNY